MTNILNYPHIGLFVVAFVMADLMCALLIRVAPRIGWLDRPLNTSSSVCLRYSIK